MYYPQYGKPIYREQFYGPTRRVDDAQFRRNYGTLNIFKEDNGGVDTIPEGRPFSRRDVNVVSNQTREFPSCGIRHVEPVKREETPVGIHMVRDAPGKRQNVQVVNVTPEYKDPLNMEQPRPMVYRDPRHTNTDHMRLALAYQGTSEQLRGSVLRAPLGKNVDGPKWSIDYTNQERFCQAVRDHVQQRARGIANFYVQLVHDRVGNITPNTPAPKIQRWTLEGEPEVRVLTLDRLLDQLVSLTAIPVTLMELADLMWDMEEYKCIASAEELDEIIKSLPVPFSDFAEAFGANSSNLKLTLLKI
ncbi:hypothetical protein AGDE_03334 [Angomonas deanei]|nr:hypothetical protein AGDE_03334 [Angomonas deanei]|eukprot:EPY40594.1 hypothetical protein AGDE_03334 [Angomonas deanei]